MNKQSLLLDDQIEKKIDKLINSMTTEEKIGQLNQVGPSFVGGFDMSLEDLIGLMLDGKISKDEFNKKMSQAKEDFSEELVKLGKIGAFLGTFGAEKLNKIQKVAVEESRLGIPLLFGYDTIHGHRTIFPIPLAESCTWDISLFKESARIAATEASATGINWVFAPMVDISRDARWGRIAESPGEDPYLASLYSKAKVEGFQGESLKNIDSVIACPKHFVAYGAAEAGRDYNTVDISYNTLHDFYLPPFKAAFEAGAATTMTAFNDLNGVPCTANKHLLTDILREQFGFNGFVVSDANAVKECIEHGISANKKEAAQKSLNAGTDIDMGSKCYEEHLEELIKEGLVSEEILNTAVRRVLRVKFMKGLFENPYISNESREKNTILDEKFINKAREIATKSIVLLKNDNKILPLNKNKKIALVGELAANAGEMMGTWALSGKKEDCVSILDGLTKCSSNIIYKPCCGVNGEINHDEIKEVIEGADIILAVIGELESMSGEASSRADISLPGKQEEFLKILKNTGKPLVVILINGRPLSIPWVAENVDSIVEAWHLGIEAGNAIADVIFGNYNPSGKLTVTFPQVTGQCPVYYNQPTTGRPGGNFKFTSRYLDTPVDPLYPFGFGLSYTEFKYDDLSVKIENEKVKITVTVSNSGNFSGEETVQVYIRDVVASRIRPKKELKTFSKIFLESGKNERVYLEIPIENLGFYNEKLEYIVESGEFIIYVGGNSRDVLEVKINL